MLDPVGERGAQGGEWARSVPPESDTLSCDYSSDSWIAEELFACPSKNSSTTLLAQACNMRCSPSLNFGRATATAPPELFAPLTLDEKGKCKSEAAFQCHRMRPKSSSA
jgi:hypothetical protein